MPRADEDAVEENSAQRQRQHRQDGAENLATMQLRLAERAHHSHGEQRQPEDDQRKVHPWKIAERREADEVERITQYSRNHQYDASPNCPIPASFHRNGPPENTTKSYPLPGAKSPRKSVQAVPPELPGKFECIGLGGAKVSSKPPSPSLAALCQPSFE